MIKLSTPFIPDKAIDDLVAVLRSGNLVQGEFVQKFESEICYYLKVKHALLVSNGTAALHLALVALNIGPGDEVIVPAFTYPATANVVELVGAKVILVDINLDDFCMNTSEIENKITQSTKAIIPVHEFGQSAKMDDIMAISQKYGISIIEDAACALGTEYRNQKVGTFGDIGCFSLHPRKAITTGEGGIVVTNNEEIANKIRCYRNHGINLDINGKPDFIYAGFNYRLTDFQAALGLSQFQMLEMLISARIQVAEYYDSYLSHFDWLTPPRLLRDRRMIFQTYHILLKDSISRDSLISYLKAQRIESNFGAYALNLLTYFRNKYNFEANSFPNATKAHKMGLALPISYTISHEQVKIITNKLELFIKTHNDFDN